MSHATYPRVVARTRSWLVQGALVVLGSVSAPMAATVTVPPATGPVSGANQNITVAAGATLNQGASGADTVRFSGGANTVVNNGTIDNSTGSKQAIRSDGGTATIANAAGAMIAAVDDAVRATGSANVAIVNYGMIASTNRSPVNSKDTAVVSVDNYGTISAGAAGTSPGIHVKDAERATLTITNRVGGLIEGAAGQEGISLGLGNDTVINAGTIRPGPGHSIAIKMRGGVDRVDLLSGATVLGHIWGGADAGDTLNLDGAGIFDYNADEFQFLNKTGAGVWVLNGNNGASAPFGTTTVAGGTLTMNGALASGTLNVNAGATLNGRGRVAANVIQAGVMAPGNSIGTLSITGTYTLLPTATLEAELSATGAGDQVNVTGTATVNGTLTPILLPLSGVYQNGTKWTLVQTTGGVAGTFLTVTPLDLLTLSTAVNYFPSRVEVELQRASYSNLAANDSQAGVAHALDRMVPTAVGQMATLIERLDFMNTSQVRAVLERLHPECYDASREMVFGVARMQATAVGNRLDQLRLSAPDASARRAATLLPGDNPVLRYVEAREPEDEFGVWVAGATNRGRQETQSDRTGFSFAGEGAALGLDYRATDTVVVGIGLGVADTNGNVYRDDSETKMNSFSFGPYLSYGDGPWYADAILDLGTDRFESTRRVILPGFEESARAEYDGWHAGATLGGGYLWRRGALAFGPTGQFEYVHASLDAFTEDGAAPFNLRVSDRDVDSLRLLPGLRAAYESVHDWGRLVPEVHVRWVHEFLDGGRTIEGEFVGSGVGHFDARVAPPDRDSVQTGAGVSVSLQADTSAYVSYDIELGRQEYTLQQLSLGFRFQF